MRDCARLTTVDSGKVLLPTLLQMARGSDRSEATEALQAALAICDERDAPAIGDLMRELLPARRLLKRFSPVQVPTEHIPTRRLAAERRLAAATTGEGA